MTNRDDVFDQECDPDELGGKFDFQAGLEAEADLIGGEWVLVRSYTVRLPHQCDYWEITKSTDPGQAVAAMEAFIAEAQAALQKLKDASDPGAPQARSIPDTPEETT